MAQKEGKIWFEYDAEFVRGKLKISPFRLPNESGVHAAKYQPFEGLFGVFNDSLPDGWGRLLLDRSLTALGIPFQSLTAIDRLAYVGKNGMGALVYTPEITFSEVEEGFLNLNQIADAIEEIQAGEPIAVLDHLRELNGSSAGALPKIVVAYNAENDQIIHGQKVLPEGFEHWLIKFPSSFVQKDIANAEFAYAQMARAAGLEMADTQLFQGNLGRAYFGTKRFDRLGRQRLHMHTASGLLNADHRIPNLDYETLMQLVIALTNDMREAEKLFRLAAFNVFAHNRDDHSKNFSFLMDSEGNWRFAPAYDLTYSFGPGGEHSTTVMGEGKSPSKTHLLRLAEKFALKGAHLIIDEVRDAINQWESFAAEAMVSKQTSKIISKAIL